LLPTKANCVPCFWNLNILLCVFTRGENHTLCVINYFFFIQLGRKSLLKNGRRRGWHCLMAKIRANISQVNNNANFNFFLKTYLLLKSIVNFSCFCEKILLGISYQIFMYGHILTSIRLIYILLLVKNTLIKWSFLYVPFIFCNARNK